MIKCIINWFLKGTKLMATIEDVQNRVQEITDFINLNANTLQEVNASLVATDLKLDEVLAFIQSLQVGSVVTQEQLDQLASNLQGIRDTAAQASASVEEARNRAQAVFAEADTLDGQP